MIRNLIKNILYAGGITLLSLAAALNPAFSQLKPIKFTLDSLPNGLKVIYQIDKSAPVVATVMHYQVGSRDETPGGTGKAHSFEHLMFEATQNIPRATIDKYVQEAGGILNAGTSFDKTVFHFEVPANEIKLPLWIESERMRKLKVDTAGVETQRGVVLEELKTRMYNQPYGTMFQKLLEHLFPGTSYGWFMGGYPDDVARATISDFKNFYDRFYQPNNAILVISGDFDIDSAKEYVSAYFGGYLRGKDPERNKMNIKPLDKPYSETIVDTLVQLPAVFIGFRTPAIGEPDYYPMSILTDILSQGESSRLYSQLIDKDKIAVSASITSLDLQAAGMMLAVGVAMTDKSIKDVEEAIIDEIQKIIDNGVTDEELTKAKNIREAGFVSGKKNVLSKAQELAEYCSYFGEPGLINTEIDKYMKVTKEDIQRVAKKYFGTDKKVVLTYVPVGYED